MKKITLLLMLLCITFGANAQILWKISGKDLPQPSYILGTHHLAPLSIIDSIADFKQVFSNVEQVYGEIIMDDMKSPANLQKIQQAILLPGDTTLHTLLTPAQYDSVAVMVKQLMGVDLKMMDKMKPAFLCTQLSVVLGMKNIKGFDPLQQLDGWVQTEALKQGKKLGSLETIDMQIALLFGSENLQRQAEQLYATAAQIGKIENTSLRVTEAYMNQDLERLESIMHEKMGNACDPLPEEEERMIYDRNENWINLMPAIMKEHTTLFAVGAGHLTGERGVLQLLKQQGYTLEAVK